MGKFSTIGGFAALLLSASGVQAGSAELSVSELSPSFARGMTLAQVVAREEARRVVVASGGYQKQTEFDNTPYRFNMKPGEKMSADQFDAWMQSRGIRIVRAKAEPVVEAAAPAVVAE